MHEPLRLAVTGNPVAHSRSPGIFRRFFSETGTDGFYSRIAADSVREAIDTAIVCKISGLNVTAPFKEEAAAAAGSRERSVEKLNAANTLVIAADGPEAASLFAANTDYLGVCESVRQAAGRVPGRTAFVAGAGGAGIAAAYALSIEGFEVTLFNRSYEKAAEKSAWIGNCRAEQLENLRKMAGSADIIVNTLPVESAVFDPASLKAGAFVFEANYRNMRDPRQGESIYYTEKSGINYISPVTWLVNQAGFAYSIFTGKALPDGGLEHSGIQGKKYTEIVGKEDLGAEKKDNIALTGFMGSGKTTAGRLLAELAGKRMIDIDSEIEKSEKMSVSEIFSSRGETHFRQVEKRITESVFRKERGAIISCGGGAVLDEDNRAVIRERSFPVWLLAPPGVSAARIHSNTRPLLSGEKRGEKAAELFNGRIDYYGKTSSMIINTSARGARETAEKIYEEISFIFKN